MSPEILSLSDLSPEILCHIFQYLPIKKILSFSMLCRKLSYTVDIYLRMCKSIDFCEGKIYAYMPLSVTDDCLNSLLKKCPHLETVYGLHPIHVERRRLRKRTALTVPGILDALSLCSYLKAIETSDLKLLEAIMQHMPQLEIIGCIRNRDGVFPPHASQRLKLQPYPKITSLHLIGVEVPELTAMPHLQHLHLQCVRFTKLQPFRAFIAQNLQSFVMKHCMGPSMSLRYLSLIIALSSSPSLRRLELVRVPLPGGLFQRAVEDSYRHNGFVCLTTLVIAGCKGVLEADIGHLMIVASQNLENIYIQPSLTKDSLFVSLSFAQCTFPKLRTLYLGYWDVLNTPDDWSNDALLSLGLAEIPDTPSSLTDSGMKIIGQLFPQLETLSVSNCPHLIAMDQWSEGTRGWQYLLDLTLQRCHCLRLSSFSSFLASLPKIEVVILIDMFREPPKGCSHVGLSAGTGLGMSSAVVSNQDEHIAVQGHPQDFELQEAEENLLEEIERDFFENDNDGFPEPHLMDLQQELFNDQNNLNHPEEQINLIPEELNIEANVLNVEDEVEQQSGPVGVASVECLNGVEIKIEDHSLSPPRTPLPEINILDDMLDHDVPPFHPVSSNHNGKHSSIVDNSNAHIQKTHEIKSKHKAVANSCKNVSEALKAPYVHVNDKHVNCSEITKRKISNEDTLMNDSESQSFTDAVRKQNPTSSSAFTCCDPNQPSTSKSTCYHTSNPGSYIKRERELSKKSSDIGMQAKNKRKQDEPCHKILISKIMDDECPPKKIKEEQFSDDEMQCDNLSGIEKFCKRNQNKISETYDTAFVGPITRHRRKVLDRNAGLKNNSMYINQGPKKGIDMVLDDKLKTEIHCPPCKVILSRVKNAYRPTSSEEQPLLKCTRFKNFYCSICEASSSTLNPPEGTQSRQVFGEENASNRQEIDVVSQGTEATSEDIRWCLRQMKTQKKSSSSNAAVNPERQRAPPLEQNSISRRIKHKKKLPQCPQPKESKATSTSDPLLEGDAVQVLRLASETLCSITVVSCGLSDIVIDRSNNLIHVEVQACRILKSCQIYFCPSLKRLNISQCPKLKMQRFLPYILELETNDHLMVSYEPCVQKYHLADIETFVLHNASLDQNFIVCHDFTDYSQEFNQTLVKTRLWAWMETTDELLKDIGFKTSEPKIKIKSRESLIYPWGHDIRRILGFYTHEFPEHYDKDIQFEMLTNNHLFASAFEVCSGKKGFPEPEHDPLLSNISFLCEAVQKSLRMQRRIKTFYISVIDQTNI